MLAVSFGHAESIQNLTAQIQKKPSAALYMDRGAAYLDAGDAKQAVADFDRALDQNAVNVQALRLRAVAQTKLGHSSNAITDLSSAIALAPADATLYLARAEAYAASGDARHANEDRDEAVRLDPTMANATANVSPAPAVEPHVGSAPITVAANIAPNSRHEPDPVVIPPAPAPAPEASADESADSLYQRGRDLVNKGQSAEGIELLNAAIQQQPNSATYYNARGFGYYLSKDFKKAIQDFDEALHLKPNYLNAVHNRALAKKNSGDNEGYAKDHELEVQLSKKK
jgi:tetratricopeptide (TPR) repeat protein